jgi:hypothetical protein
MKANPLKCYFGHKTINSLRQNQEGIIQAGLFPGYAGSYPCLLLSGHFEAVDPSVLFSTPPPPSPHAVRINGIV